MRAAIQTGIRSVEVRDIPEPVPDAVSGLLRVRTAGICGSDLHPYHERAEAQTRPSGHEVSGEVIHLPASYAGPARIGDLVALDGVLGAACGDCDFCKAGQFFPNP
jgi:threonine dehydrogenase-like Zn-dependent dehydrogenase